MDKSSALPGNSLVDGRGNVKKGKIAELMMNNVKNKGKGAGNVNVPRNGYLEISPQIEYNGEKIICRVFAARHSERGRE